MVSDTNVNAVSKFQWSKVNNKFGALSYILFVVACFLPLATIKIFGFKQTIYATDIVSTSTMALMVIGALLCITGAPKLLAKSVAAIAVFYFYYTCYTNYSDLSDTVNAFGGNGGFGGLGGSSRHSREAQSVLSQAIGMLSVGFWLMLTSFIMMKVFLISSYTESPFWGPIKAKFLEMTNKDKVLEMASKDNIEKVREMATQGANITKAKVAEGLEKASEKASDIKEKAEAAKEAVKEVDAKREASTVETAEKAETLEQTIKPKS